MTTPISGLMPQPQQPLAFAPMALPTQTPMIVTTPTAQPAPAPAAPPVAPAKRFRLYMPIIDADGQKRDAIDLRMPTLRDRDAMLEASDGMQQIADVVARLSGLSVDAVLAMAPVNLIEINEWLMELVNASLAGPAPVEGDPLPPPSLTIKLDYPIGTAERRLTEITVKAPTLGAAIGLGNARNADKSAMLYHRLTGVALDLIKSLALVDIAKIEAYFAPFSQRPVPRPEAMTSHAAMEAVATAGGISQPISPTN
jgi:hypothetical protein